MKDSNDIANLYKTLGQNPNQYQEVVRDEELAQANERWPLIAAMHDSDFSPPPVDQKKRGPRERAPLVVLEHENELEVGAHDYHERVETVKAIELLADPALTPTWAPDMHDAPAVVSPEPSKDFIETGWIAPERTPAQLELAAQAALAAAAAHEAQAIKEAQAAKEEQIQRDLEAAAQEQAELAAEAAKESEAAQTAQAAEQIRAAQAAREAQATQEAQAARALQAAKEAQAAKDAQATQSAQAVREAAIVKAAQVARDQRATTAKQVAEAPKPAPVTVSVPVAAVVQKQISNVEATKKAVSTVSTSIFQDDTKVVFAGAPASIFSESTLAESLMDEAASDFDEMDSDLEPFIDDESDPFIEEEIAPVVANSRRQRVAVEPVAQPKAVAVTPAPRVIEKPAPTTSPEPTSVVTLTHMRMRVSSEPRPLAALFNRLSGSAPTPSGAAEGKKSLLFERMKRT